jgi:hypothetical protein
LAYIERHRSRDIGYTASIAAQVNGLITTLHYRERQSAIAAQRRYCAKNAAGLQ